MNSNDKVANVIDELTSIIWDYIILGGLLVITIAVVIWLIKRNLN